MGGKREGREKGGWPTRQNLCPLTDKILATCVFIVIVLVSDVTVVILSDVIVFLAETNQKLNFFSQDNKVNYLLLISSLII